MKLFYSLLAFCTRQEGLMGYFDDRHWQVVYADGMESMTMPFGNALEYAHIFPSRGVFASSGYFKGKKIPINKLPGECLWK